MTWTLLPNMAQRFQAFYGTEYPELACVSCHGANAEEVSYRMPNGLHPLDPDRMPTPGPEDSRTGRVVTFMRDVVVPETNRLMHAGGTVECFSCHARAGAP